MRRTLLVALGGLLLGGIIHIAVVFMVPYYANRDAWAQMDQDNRAFTFQINVKDLTNNDDLKAYVANPDGSQLYRILEGRLFTASATFEF